MKRFLRTISAFFILFTTFSAYSQNKDFSMDSLLGLDLEQLMELNNKNQCKHKRNTGNCIAHK